MCVCEERGEECVGVTALATKELHLSKLRFRSRAIPKLRRFQSVDDLQLNTERENVLNLCLLLDTFKIIYLQLTQGLHCIV